MIRNRRYYMHGLETQLYPVHLVKAEGWVQQQIAICLPIFVMGGRHFSSLQYRSALKI